jgi:hypothetical protein
MERHEWFYEKLKSSRVAFEEDPRFATLNLSETFKPWDDLITESEDLLKGRAPSTRALRIRKRKKIKIIMETVGAEVFVLCILSTTITKFKDVEDNWLKLELPDWWARVSHPKPLTEAVRVLAREFPGTFNLCELT